MVNKFDIFYQTKKIIIYKNKVEKGNIDMLFVLSEFLEEDGLSECH